MRKSKPIQSVELAPTLTEHWYLINGEKLYPSITTILKYYPKSEQLTKWAAEQGWEESREILSDAGRRGTQVHEAIHQLLTGSEIIKEHFELSEWWKLNAFKSWYEENNQKGSQGIQIIETEKRIVSQKYRYAGTVDCLCRLDDKVFVIDWKTSKNAYPHFALQVAAYAHALVEMEIVPSVDKTACLILGTRSRSAFRFTEYENWKDDFKAFLAIKSIFDREQPEPPQVLNLPESLKLGCPDCGL